jgi:acyl CoA:acetate/3-ketoacid CoA transferase alpha subunit
MAIDKRVKTAAEALLDVQDGATVFITGFGGAGFPNVLIRALCERGAKELTLVVNSATHSYSLTHELLTRVICSAARGMARILGIRTPVGAGRIEPCSPQARLPNAFALAG